MDPTFRVVPSVTSAFPSPEWELPHGAMATNRTLLPSAPSLDAAGSAVLAGGT